MRIAHLSDFHFRHRVGHETQNEPQRNGDLRRRMETAMVRVNAQQPDLLVLSGDLIDYPLDALDDPDTLALGLADYRFLRELLSTVHCPIAAVPGNHDHPALFDDISGDLGPDFPCAGHRVLCFFDAEDETHLPHRQGLDRERMHGALTDSDPAPQIHIQHFLLWPHLQEDYPYNYPDHAELRRALTESGKARLSLSGHYHLGFAPVCVEGVTYAGVPAFCEPPHPLWLYELSADGVQLTEIHCID